VGMVAGGRQARPPSACTRRNARPHGARYAVFYAHLVAMELALAGEVGGRDHGLPAGFRCFHPIWCRRASHRAAYGGSSGLEGGAMIIVPPSLPMMFV